jgi:NAD(P)-dependent dehydrogenase (short-subunit alcohol dehydrogenase family)
MKISFHTALITGSSRGFGRAIAVKLAQEGVKKITVHYLIRKDEAEKTVACFRDAGAEGVLLQGDTSNAKRAEEIVDEAAEKLGGCDIFVQSVIPQLDQIYEHTLATEVPLAKWRLAFDTQALAFFVGARAAAKHMSVFGISEEATDFYYPNAMPRSTYLTRIPGGNHVAWRVHRDQWPGRS